MDDKQTVWYTPYQIPGSDEEHFIYYNLVTAEHFRHLEKQCLKRDKKTGQRIMVLPHWQRLKCKIYKACTQLNKMLIKQNKASFKDKHQDPDGQ